MGYEQAGRPDVRGYGGSDPRHSSTTKTLQYTDPGATPHRPVGPVAPENQSPPINNHGWPRFGRPPNPGAQANMPPSTYTAQAKTNSAQGGWNHNIPHAGMLQRNNSPQSVMQSGWPQGGPRAAMPQRNNSPQLAMESGWPQDAPRAAVPQNSYRPQLAMQRGWPQVAPRAVVPQTNGRPQLALQSGWPQAVPHATAPQTNNMPQTAPQRVNHSLNAMQGVFDDKETPGSENWSQQPYQYNGTHQPYPHEMKQKEPEQDWATPLSQLASWDETERRDHRAPEADLHGNRPQGIISGLPPLNDDSSADNVLELGPTGKQMGFEPDTKENHVGREIHPQGKGQGNLEVTPEWPQKNGSHRLPGQDEGSNIVEPNEKAASKISRGYEAWKRFNRSIERDDNISHLKSFDNMKPPGQESTSVHTNIGRGQAEKARLSSQQDRPENDQTAGKGTHGFSAVIDTDRGKKGEGRESYSGEMRGSAAAGAGTQSQTEIGAVVGQSHVSYDQDKESKTPQEKGQAKESSDATNVSERNSSSGVTAGSVIPKTPLEKDSTGEEIEDTAKRNNEFPPDPDESQRKDNVRMDSKIRQSMIDSLNSDNAISRRPPLASRRSKSLETERSAKRMRADPSHTASRAENNPKSSDPSASGAVRRSVTPAPTPPRNRSLLSQLRRSRSDGCVDDDSARVSVIDAPSTKSRSIAAATRGVHPSPDAAPGGRSARRPQRRGRRDTPDRWEGSAGGSRATGGRRTPQRTRAPRPLPDPDQQDGDDRYDF